MPKYLNNSESITEISSQPTRHCLLLTLISAPQSGNKRGGLCFSHTSAKLQCFCHITELLAASR